MNIDSDSYYANHYESIMSRGLVGLMAKLNHLSLEHAPFAIQRMNLPDSKILEVGAGHGQHYKYVDTNFGSYLMTDIRPHLFKTVELESSKVRIEDKSIDAEYLPYPENSFDRLVATCLLIHLPNPERALREWKRVVKSNGLITIYLPCESGLLLRLAQSVSTRRKQKKIGIDAKYLHYKEHPYTYPFLISILKNVFGENLKVRKFPFIYGGFDLNLWAVASIKNIK